MDATSGRGDCMSAFVLAAVLGVPVYCLSLGCAGAAAADSASSAPATRSLSPEPEDGNPFLPSTRKPDEFAPGIVHRVGRAVGIGFGPSYLYTTRPLTMEEAKRFAGNRLPKKQPATQVQFAYYREWLAWQVWLSFHASPETCKSMALQLMEDWNKAFPENVVPVMLRPIDKAAQEEYRDFRRNQKAGAIVNHPYREDSTNMPIQWFVPEEIAHGLVGGGGQGNKVKVWVDLDEGVLFYQEGSGSAEGGEQGGE